MFYAIETLVGLEAAAWPHRDSDPESRTHWLSHEPGGIEVGLEEAPENGQHRLSRSWSEPTNYDKVKSAHDYIYGAIQKLRNSTDGMGTFQRIKLRLNPGLPFITIWDRELAMRFQRRFPPFGAETWHHALDRLNFVLFNDPLLDGPDVTHSGCPFCSRKDICGHIVAALIEKSPGGGVRAGMLHPFCSHLWKLIGALATEISKSTSAGHQGDAVHPSLQGTLYEATTSVSFAEASHSARWVRRSIVESLGDQVIQKPVVFPAPHQYGGNGFMFYAEDAIAAAWKASRFMVAEIEAAAVSFGRQECLHEIG
jgi:hypothetical protein